LYKNSAGSLVCSEFPEIAWKRWHFVKTSHDWWKRLSKLETDPVALTILREYIEEVGAQFQVEKLEDWYRVTNEQLINERHRLHLFGGLIQVLKLTFPSHPWKEPSDTTENRLPVTQTVVQHKIADLLPRTPLIVAN